MQLQLHQLKSGTFRAPVSFKFATDEVNNSGDTVFVDLKFIGRFERISDERRKAFKEAVAAIEKQVDSGDLDTAQGIEQVKSITREYVAGYWVGFEKHPKHDFPFLDADGAPLTSSPDTIKAMLEYDEIQLAVGKAFSSVSEKQAQDLLRGNSRK